MEDPFAGTNFSFTEQLQAQLPPQLPLPAQAEQFPLHAFTKFMRDRVFLQSPPPYFSLITRDLLMKKTQLAEQQLLSGQLPAQAELQAIAQQLEEEQQLPSTVVLPAQEEQQLPATVVLPAQEEQQLPATVVLPAQVGQQLPATATVPLPAQAEQQENAELPPQPQPLDAFTFSAWTTLYSNLEYLYRLYIGASYERPLPIQAVGSDFDIRFNFGNFMFQLAAGRVQNGGLVTDRRAVLMSTIAAMTVAAFIGFIVNALKKNN